jgi:adenosylcobinamide-GDP ribazoletransferase
MGEGLRLALTMFTVMPASRPARANRRSAAAAMLWCPLVGAGIAAVASAVLLAGRHAFAGPTVWISGIHVELIIGPLLASALAVTARALLTRGLHLDGLADTVDGLASARPRAEALAVMRDGPVGALGAVALLLVLLTDVIALATSTVEHRGTQALVIAVVTGHVAMVWACTSGIPAARLDGMGALVAGTVSRRAATGWTLLLLLGAGLAGRFDTGSVHGCVRSLVAVAVALGLSWALRRHAVRRLGGITGDVLGALCEVAILASLVVTAAGRP